MDQRGRFDAGRKARKAIYNSKQWKQLRESKRLHDPYCVDCRDEGGLVPFTDLDHIIDLADGGAPFDLDNVAGRCHSHHSSKTARTRGWGRGGS